MTTMIRPEKAVQHVALHLMINQLSVSTMPIAIRKRSFILNDIPAQLSINTDAQTLATVLGTLLNTMLNHSDNNCIRITARRHGNVMLLHFRNNHSLGGQSFANNLERVQTIAEKLGGTITVNDFRTGTTTIAVSITNYTN